MDLATLISARRKRLGLSLRELEQRAKDAGRPVSRSMISLYERGEVATRPSLEVIHGLAAALECTFEEVAAAAAQSFASDLTRSQERQTSHRAEAWLRLTSDRTDDEVEELLLIVGQVLRMRDMDRPNGLPKTE